MVLMDLASLASSITLALPRLVADSAQRACDANIFGPGVGYSFFQPASTGNNEKIDHESAQAWASLQSTTLGILDTGPMGRAVARVAQQRFGADVVHYRSAIAGDIRPHTKPRPQSFREVLATRMICIVLPWPEDITALIQNNKRAPVRAQDFLVVWRRSPAIERALAYLEEHYAESVPLCHVAEVACLSKFHLVRRFAATLGITPHRYQLSLRLSRAAAMLREGTRIADIAQCVGFADHSHLGRSFRALMGTTPTEYVRNVLRIEMEQFSSIRPLHSRIRYTGWLYDHRAGEIPPRHESLLEQLKVGTRG